MTVSYLMIEIKICVLTKRLLLADSKTKTLLVFEISAFLHRMLELSYEFQTLF